MIGTTAITDNGKIHADKVIVATHFPFINTHGSYYLKLYQHRSYVLALKNAQNVNGMYVDECRTGLSFRNYGDLLLLGGGAHRTGKEGGCYKELRDFAAMLLCDVVCNSHNDFERIFSPSRDIIKPQLLVNGFEAAKNLMTFTEKRCPHLGCALKWNRDEHSWDCACHGSRFSKEGKVLDNPANGDLKK